LKVNLRQGFFNNDNARKGQLNSGADLSNNKMQYNRITTVGLHKIAWMR